MAETRPPASPPEHDRLTPSILSPSFVVQSNVALPHNTHSLSRTHTWEGVWGGAVRVRASRDDADLTPAVVPWTVALSPLDLQARCLFARVRACVRAFACVCACVCVRAVKGTEGAPFVSCLKEREGEGVVDGEWEDHS